MNTISVDFNNLDSYFLLSYLQKWRRRGLPVPVVAVFRRTCWQSKHPPWFGRRCHGLKQMGEPSTLFHIQQ